MAGGAWRPHSRDQGIDSPSTKLKSRDTTKTRHVQWEERMLFAMPRAVALVATTVLAVSFAGLPAKAQVKTIEQGKLHIAMNGDMPMTQLKDGVLSGTDGELMVYIAKKLGLQPVIHQM